DADRSAIYLDEHHSLVNGKGIVSSARRPEALTASAKRKIQRYVRLWRNRSDGAWPVHPSQQPDAAIGAPGLFEVWRDRISYYWFARYDSMVLFLYSFLPLRVLGGYRAVRNRVAAVNQLAATSEHTP